MTRFAKSAAVAIVLSLAGGAAFAAEACKCCKDGEKMECCDKMKDKAPAPKPGEAQPAPSEHKH